MVTFKLYIAWEKLFRLAEQAESDQVSDQELLWAWRKFRLLEKEIVFSPSDINRKFSIRTDPGVAGPKTPDTKNIVYWIERGDNSYNYIVVWNSSRGRQITKCDLLYAKESFRTGQWYWIEEPRAVYFCKQCTIQTNKLMNKESSV